MKRKGIVMLHVKDGTKLLRSIEGQRNSKKEVSSVKGNGVVRLHRVL